MDKIRLGKTDLYVTKTAFGALPIQRDDTETAVRLVRKAYDSGINFFDTANAYTDSEQKLGIALHDVRHDVIFATKSGAGTKAELIAHIENSLRQLRTDYIDLFQFHNPASLPDPEDPDGIYAAALELKKKGYIRHIGLSNHRLKIAEACIASGNFETLQFPFCYLASSRDLALVHACKEADMGFIAMKGLSGGLLNNAKACYAFMQQFPNVVPIWGMQRDCELDEWLRLTEENPQMDDTLLAVIEHDKKELAGSFCRSCGYCLPCTVGIDIPQAARMAQLLRRSPYLPYMSDDWYKAMHKVESCVHCNVCVSRCPYGLDTPSLLVEMLKDYDEFYAQHHEKVK